MSLDVLRADGSGYAVQDRWLIPGGEPISVGSELSVLVDPQRQDRVVINWDRTREIYETKREERRRLLSVGVPVPVSKLREAAKASGLVQHAPKPTPAEEGVGVGRPMSQDARTPEPSTDDEIIERLERLAALHSAGELTDDEFEAVKRHLIA